MLTRKYFIQPLWICCFIAAGALCSIHAQSPGAGRRATLTDNSVVKDSSGAVYPAVLWKNLLGTGRFILRAKDAQDEDTEYLLVRLTEEEYKRRIENAPKPRESEYFTTGKPISSFTATDINGKKYKLKDLKGKVVVINFWFIACGPCQQEIPELNKLADEYKDSANVVFLAVCLDEKSPIEEFLEKKPFNYNIIHNGRYITSQYGIRSYPTHVIVDKEGNVVFHTSGYSLSLGGWLRKMIAKALE